MVFVSTIPTPHKYKLNKCLHRHLKSLFLNQTQILQRVLQINILEITISHVCVFIDGY